MIKMELVKWFTSRRKRTKLKLTEKKNTQNCKDPIQAISDAGRCCSWCEAYHAWYVPNALIWPKVQANAMNAPSTVKLALRPPSGNLSGLFASLCSSMAFENYRDVARKRSKKRLLCKIPCLKRVHADNNKVKSAFFYCA